MKRLIVFGGLPGSGKSTLSKMYVEKVDGVWLSVDPIEGAMKLSGVKNNRQLGVAAYEVVRVLADQNLTQNKIVVVDAVNPVKETRDIWHTLAIQQGIAVEFVECVIHDQGLHKQRIEKRIRKIPGMREITWERVQFRKSEYQPWKDKRIIIQTDGSIQKSFQELLRKLGDD